MARVKAHEFEIDKKSNLRSIKGLCEPKVECDTDTSHSSFNSVQPYETKASAPTSSFLVETTEDVVELFEILENASFDLNKQLNATPRSGSLVAMTEEKRSQILSRSTPDLDYYFENDENDQKDKDRGVKANDSFDFSEVWWDEKHETQSQAELPVTMKMNKKPSMRLKNPSLVSSPTRSKSEKPASGSPRLLSSSPQPSPSPLAKVNNASPASFTRSFRKARSYGQILDDPPPSPAAENIPEHCGVIPAPPLHKEEKSESVPASTPHLSTPVSGKRKKKCIKVRAKDLGIFEPGSSSSQSGSPQQMDLNKVQDAFRKLFGTSTTPGEVNSDAKTPKIRFPSRGRASLKSRGDAEEGTERERRSNHRSRSRTNRSTRTLMSREEGGTADPSKSPTKPSRLRSLSRPRRSVRAPLDAEAIESLKQSQSHHPEALARAGETSSGDPVVDSKQDNAAKQPLRRRSSSLSPKKVKKSPAAELDSRSSGLVRLDLPSHHRSEATLRQENAPITSEAVILPRRRSSSLSPKKVKDASHDDGIGPDHVRQKSKTPLRTHPTIKLSNAEPSIPCLAQPKNLGETSGRGMIRTGHWVARDIGITEVQLQQLYAAGYQITERP